MILVFECKTCKTQNKLSHKFNDRGEISYKKIELLEFCHSCGARNELNANEIKAIESNYSRYIYLISLIISLVLITFVYVFFEGKIALLGLRRRFYIYSLIFAIPFLIANLIKSSERKSIKNFNNYYV